MSGPATFSGTTYQSRVLAFIETHILAQMRLGWLGQSDDTPIAVSAETGGPGDDIRIEFGERVQPAEVQAKHGLSGVARLRDAINAVRKSSLGAQMPVIVATNRAASRTIYQEIGPDLERLRSGRTDRLKAETTRLIAELGNDTEILRRIVIVTVDVDRPHEPETKFALSLLAGVLEHPEQAEAAWAALVSDAGDLAARRLQRTRKELVDVLGAAKISVRPPSRDDRWHRRLDFTRELLQRRHAAAALSALRELSNELGTLTADPLVRYRLFQQTAAALLQLDRPRDSLEFSQRALDVDPNGSHALNTAAASALLLGNLDLAEQFNGRALREHPDDTSAWATAAHIARSAGRDVPTPPPGVAAASDYQTALARVAMDDGDLQKVLSLTSNLLRGGVRTEDVLFLRANALLSLDPVSLPALRERQTEAERLAGELIDLLADDEAHPLASKALVLRSAARRALGDFEGADADLAIARSIQPDDPDAIRHAAFAFLDAGDESSALRVLRHPIVDDNRSLLTLRAQVLARSGDSIDARKDLDAAMNHAADDLLDPVGARLTQAEVAIVLGDIPLAERILQLIPNESHSDRRYVLTLGRIAFARQEPETGLEHFQKAAREWEDKRAEILSEAAAYLRKLNRATDAAAVFDQIGLRAVPTEALKYYGAALMESQNFAGAQRLVNFLAGEGELPDWALSIATNLALTQEDIEGAIRHLSSLVTRPSAAERERLILAQLLLVVGRKTEALVHLDALVDREGMSPTQRMDLASLLSEAGREADANNIAFRAFRDNPLDPAIHRSFIGLLLTNDATPPAVDQVGANTHVVLRGSDDSLRRYTIYADGPIDPLRGELSLKDAHATGLIGKRVGDKVASIGGRWPTESWTVEEVAPAILHALRDAAEHYEDRFPSEPFFLKGFRIGDGKSVTDLAPVIASLEERRAHVVRVLGVYRKDVTPLGMVANALRGTIADVIDTIAVDSETAGPLFVEWADSDGQAASLATAQTATKIVLSRSGLKTAEDLGILSILGDAFSLVAPSSLLQELRQEERLEADRVLTGHRTISARDDGRLEGREFGPGDPALVRRHDAARQLLAWLEAEAVIAPRPLESIPAAGSREDQLRGIIGHSSDDAVALAKHLGIPVHADDLGLRRLLPWAAGHSFSTLTLLPALCARALITPESRDDKLLALIARDYRHALPTKDLLYRAVRQSVTGDRRLVRKAFALLSEPAMTPTDAARIAAQLLRSAALSNLSTASVSDLTEMALDGMASRWQRPICARLLVKEATDQLNLLGKALSEVRDVCMRFAKA